MEDDLKRSWEISTHPGQCLPWGWPGPLQAGTWGGIFLHHRAERTHLVSYHLPWFTSALQWAVSVSWAGRLPLSFPSPSPSPIFSAACCAGLNPHHPQEREGRCQNLSGGQDGGRTPLTSPWNSLDLSRQSSRNILVSQLPERLICSVNNKRVQKTLVAEGNLTWPRRKKEPWEQQGKTHSINKRPRYQERLSTWDVFPQANLKYHIFEVSVS